MKKDDIIQSSWLSYLKWWKHSVADEEKPPTEDDFWVWYCMKQDQPRAELTTAD